MTIIEIKNYIKILSADQTKIKKAIRNVKISVNKDFLYTQYKKNSILITNLHKELENKYNIPESSHTYKNQYINKISSQFSIKYNKNIILPTYSIYIYEKNNNINIAFNLLSYFSSYFSISNRTIDEIIEIYEKLEPFVLDNKIKIDEKYNILKKHIDDFQLYTEQINKKYNDLIQKHQSIIDQNNEEIHLLKIARNQEITNSINKSNLNKEKQIFNNILNSISDKSKKLGKKALSNILRKKKLINLI